MATRNGPWQNYGRIEWSNSVGSVSQSTTSISVTVIGYLRMDQYRSSYHTGQVRYSGRWGSGSKSVSHHLDPNQRAEMHRATVTVNLTDSAQSLSYTLSADHFAYGAPHTTGDTWSFSVPARYARTPTGLTVTRASDTRMDLSWTRNSTYTAVVVQRSNNGTSGWVQVGRPTGNAASFADTTVQANQRYYYRVAGVGGSGQSPWSSVVGPRYTTPAAPTGISATRVSNTEIVVDATGLPPYATSYDIEDGGSVVATSVSLPWSHLNPSLSIPHTYRIRAKNGSLVGPWSQASSTVQLLSAPNAPTGLSPNGAVLGSDSALSLSWTHNPVDTTPQTAYELRWRYVSASWTTISGATQSTASIAPLPDTEIEWQVRTRGQYASANPWSPWSALATVAVAANPGVAINSPDPVWGEPRIIAEWTFFQDAGRPQTSWELQLLDGDGSIVEARSGGGSTGSLVLDHRAGHDESYTLRVRAATGSAWSAWAVQPFEVVFVPPAPADVESSWEEEAGAMELTIDAYTSSAIPDVTNLFTNPNLVGDGTYATVAENLFTNPNLVGDGTWGVARRNRFPNPVINSTVTTGFNLVAGNGGAASLSNTAVGTPPAAWPEASRVVRAQWTTAPTNTNVIPALQITHISATAGQAIPYSLFARRSKSGVLRFQASWLGSSTGTRFLETTDVLGANEWVLIEGTFAPPYGITSVQFSIATPQGDFPTAGEYIDVTGLTTDHNRIRFDGSTPNYSLDPDMRSSWLGTTNNSESVMEIEQVRGLTTINAIAGVSTWEGKPAMRVIPTGSNQSVARITIPAVALTLGTVIGTLNMIQPLTGTLWSGRGTLYASDPITVSTPAAPNVAGTTDIRLQFANQASGAFVDFVNGASQGNGDVWWTDIGLFEGDYVGPAFSGADDPEVTGFTQPEDFRTRWSGAVGNSTSLLEIERVRGISPNQGIAGVSSYAGKPAIRFIPTGTADSYFNFTAPVAARNGGTVLGTAHLAEPLAGTLSTPLALFAGAPNQTSTPAPNTPGSYPLRFTYSALSSAYAIRWRHGGAQDSGDVWWTDIGLFEGEYEGPWFAGDSGMFHVDGSPMLPKWDGAPNNSTSTATMMTRAQDVLVERSVDGGRTWETFIPRSPLTGAEDGLNVSDWQSLSCGTTIYRVTTYASSGASSVMTHEAVSDSMANFLNGGPSFSITSRLPGDPAVSITGGRVRATEEYAGRSLPVAYSSRRVSRNVNVSGTIMDKPLDEDGNPLAGEFAEASRNDLEELSLERMPLHQHRDPYGNRIVGSLSQISLSQTGGFRTCGEGCLNTIWTFDYTIVESGGYAGGSD